MGSVERSFESGPMTASEIALHLLGNCATLEHFEVFMFGSTLHGVGEDIDILVVGPDGDALSKLKQEMRIVGDFMPLHIFYMQPSEERRTEFVARQHCVHLRKLSTRL